MKCPSCDHDLHERGCPLVRYDGSRCACAYDITKPPRADEIAQAVSSITGLPVPALPVHPEANLYAAFLQGEIVGMALRAKNGDTEALNMKIAEVDMDQDVDGNWLNHVVITTQSGARIRVTVTPEPEEA